MLRTSQLITTFTGLLPASRMKNSILRILGHRVHPSAHIASNLIIGVVKLEIGAHSTIRMLNVIRDTCLSLDDNAILGSFNWISSAKALNLFPDYEGKLVIGNSCGINSRNYFDCTGGIFFGEFSDLAGVRSTFISHYIDTRINSQTCKPIQIGQRTMLSSNIKVAPGANVGSKSLVAMGTVLIANNYPSESLIAGVPGKCKSRREGDWFQRSDGPSRNPFV